MSKNHCPKHEGWNKDCFNCDQHKTIFDLRAQLAEAQKECADAILVAQHEKERDALHAKLDSARKALRAVRADAVKCQDSAEPRQYFITRWAMEKVEANMSDAQPMPDTHARDSLFQAIERAGRNQTCHYISLDEWTAICQAFTEWTGVKTAHAEKDPTPSVPAECHPDRPANWKGQCSQCARAARESKP